MDEHNSGFLTYEEFAHGMRRLFKLNSDDMFALEMLVDRDHDGNGKESYCGEMFIRCWRLQVHT